MPTSALLDHAQPDIHLDAVPEIMPEAPCVQFFFQGESRAFVTNILTMNPWAYGLGSGTETREALYAEGMLFCAQASMALALWAFPEFDLAQDIALESVVPRGASPLRVLATLLPGLAPGDSPLTVPLWGWADQTLRAVAQHADALEADGYDISPWMALVFAGASIMPLGRRYSFEGDMERELQAQVRNLQYAHRCALAGRMTHDGADGTRTPVAPRVRDVALELLASLADRVRQGEADARVVLTQADVLMVALSGAPLCGEASMLLAAHARA